MKIQSGKTAIVTGASSGIGRATAEALARAGFTVFGTSRKTTSKGPKGVLMLTCDVTDDESVASLISAVLSQTGRIDLLVNNAGIGLFGGAEESSVSQSQALFDVNLFGVMRMTNAVLPAMRQRGEGRIINIGSILGLVPAPYSNMRSRGTRNRSITRFVPSIFASRSSNRHLSTVFDQNGIEPDSVTKEYDQARAGVDALLRDVTPKADLPEVVAKVVLKAATDKRPRRRYTAGKTARLVSMLRRFAPAETFDKTLRKQFRLPA
jgi:NAD(P)-dependent dehydrogenase (short-subunit alcohol dehydrogenase family)